MSQYKVYPAYKDSGVEWIGQVPEHWQLRKVAWDLVMSIGWTPDTKNRRYYGGDYNWVSIADLTKNRINETGQKITQLAVDEMKGSQAPAGSLLFSYKLTIGMVALLDQPAYTNEAIAAFYPNKKINMNFWKYAVVVILPRYSRKNIYNSDLLNQELMNSARFYAPSYDEQATIAAALDRETARIDALVEKKTRFIELLKEKRQALITHAVTKGLDPNVKMKDSGVEWIGQVPVHWKIAPVKYHYDARLGKMIQPAAVSDRDIEVPYHRAQTVQWERIVESDIKEMWASPRDIEQFSVSEGDLLICEGGDVCRAAIVKQPPEKNMIFQNSIHRIRSKGEYGVGWVMRLMQHLRSSEWIDVLCNKNTIVHFTSDKLGSLECPLPPPDEQASIAAALDRETARIDALIGKAEQSITLLKERRSAFITAAVTGQIDLRGKQ
ncbi:restriction endonuclease subunit S [Candidatus Dependentiae bacterium]|nr:MAG: restriction endonuclease subunit S [Candidatus Dependentiae bacterium]